MWTTRLVVLLLLALVPFDLEAQSQSPSTDSVNQQTLNSGQLDALVAPIALYPDTLLAQVLMASTYPLEVAQAERWVTEHKKLQEDQLKKEAEKQRWEDSVKSLIATPSVLTMMGSKLDWTQKLGDAVLAQQPDVMDAIQRLRTKAYANDKLQTTKEQKVTVRLDNNRQLIAIEPTTPGTIYVPYYDPAVIYGEWPYPQYPPYSWYPEPGYIASGVIATGLAFGAAYALGRWATGGRWWGGNINWGGRNINISRGARVEHWQHNASHRRGVAYNNANVRQKFAGNAARAGNKGQLDFRGRDGKQVIKPGNREKSGDRGGKKQAGQAKQRQAKANHPSQKRAAQNPASRKAAQQQRHRPPSRTARSGNRQNIAASRGSRVGGRSFNYGGRDIGRRSGGGRGFSGRGGGRRGGGRRSDIRLKYDVRLLGRFDNGLGFYRFTYGGSARAYVGVMAQEVQSIAPEAVARGRDGYLRVHYRKLGLRFQTHDQWIASGGHIPRLNRTLSRARNAAQ